MGYIRALPTAKPTAVYDPRRCGKIHRSHAVKGTVKETTIVFNTHPTQGDGRTCPKCRVASDVTNTRCPRCGSVYGNGR